MPKIKYIAAGFEKDAEKVLKEFVRANSPEFTVFSEIWRKHNFSAIFMYRSAKELVQFTQEIFQLTLNILETTEGFHQIGAFYLLYALFQTQPLDPKIRIRITLEQYKRLSEMIKVAVTMKCKTLNYTIRFLMKNGAFDFVACRYLQGPLHANPETEVETMPPKVDSIIKNLKDSSKSLFEDNAWKELEEISDSYAEATKDITFLTSEETIPDFKRILKCLREEHKLLTADGNDSSASGQSDGEQDNIGSRRAEIKSNAFASKALFKHFNLTDEDLDEDYERITRSRSERDSLVQRDKLSKEATMSEDDLEIVEKGAKPKRHNKPCKKKTQVAKGRRKVKKQKTEKELQQLEIGEFPKDTKLKGHKKRGPVARTSYYGSFTEEPLKETSDKFASLFLTNAEDSDHEDIDDPDKEDHEDIDDPDKEDHEDIDDPDELNIIGSA